LGSRAIRLRPPNRDVAVVAAPHSGQSGKAEQAQYPPVVEASFIVNLDLAGGLDGAVSPRSRCGSQKDEGSSRCPD